MTYVILCRDIDNSLKWTVFIDSDIIKTYKKYKTVSYVGVDVTVVKILLTTMSIFCKLNNINVNSTDCMH